MSARASALRAPPPEMLARTGAGTLLAAVVAFASWRTALLAEAATPSFWLLPALLAGGLVSGLLAGLLGIGGALVTLPVLHAVLPSLGIADADVPATAVSTALMAMMPTTLVAAWRQHRHAAIDIAALRSLVAPMMLGALLGGAAAAWVDGPALALAFAVWSLGYGSRLAAFPATVRTPSVAPAPAPGAFAAWLVGMAMAAFCACIGMGGGAVVTPYLQRRGLDFRRAVATSGALNLCIALGGSAMLWIAAGLASMPSCRACWPAALLLGFGAVVAAPCGVALAHRLSSGLLRRIVGAIYLLSALALIVEVAR